MSIKQHIYGLCGYAGAGKDTVADLLVTHAGFRKLAWADALRAEAAEAFAAPLDLFTSRDTKDTPTPLLTLRRAPLGLVGAVVVAHGLDETFGELAPFLDQPRSPRQILQWWGTEYRRRQDPDYWTRKLSQRVAYYANDLHERHFVIPDCRFPNEVAALRALGGELWRVSRPGIAPAGNHVSVTDGSEFKPEAVIDNCADLRHAAQQALGRYWQRDSGLALVRVEVA